MKILITSGGCKVPIDDVRHIGNFSSGRYGAELLYQFWMKGGHDIIFFHEKGSGIGGFRGMDVELNGSTIRFIQYKDYWDYLNVKNIIKIEQPDIIISAAAISDYVFNKIDGKISSSDDTLTLTLTKGEKVIKSFRELAPSALIVGFKLLVSPSEEEINLAVDKVFDSGADMAIYNDLTELRKGDSSRRLYYGKDRGVKGYARTDDVNYFVDEFIMEATIRKVFNR